MSEILTKTIKENGMDFLITYQVVEGIEQQLSITNLTKDKSIVSKNYQKPFFIELLEGFLTHNDP